MRHQWELDELCIAPLAKIKGSLEAVFPENENEQHQHEIQSLVDEAKTKAGHVRDQWLEIITNKGFQDLNDEANHTADDTADDTADRRKKPIPMQGTLEILLELCCRSARDQEFEKEAKAPKTKSSLWNRIRRALTLDADTTRVPASELRSRLSVRKIKKRLRIAVDSRLRELKLHLDQAEDFPAKNRPPRVIHVCFLCGTTGATIEVITLTPAKRCLEHVRNQRILRTGWIWRVCEKDKPITRMDMKYHMSQAYKRDIEPVACCRICRRMRRYDELYTSGKSGTGSKSTPFSCAELVCEQRCQIFDAGFLGPTSRRRLVEQFLRSVQWSLQQGRD